MSPTTFFLLLLFSIAAPLAQSQSPKPQLPAPSPASAACNGIFLSYTYTSGAKIPPILTLDPTKQPYKFKSTLTIINNSPDELKSWRVFVGFNHDEFLVSASNAVLADGNSLPGRVGNGTVFAGFPSTDLKTAIETAGEITQMSAKIDLVGTQFGIGPPGVPMPNNITLANDGFVCPEATMEGKREMQVCCTPDLNAVNNTIIAEEFLPRKDGDMTIMYDVLRTYDSNYWAEVTISNHNPLGRLDNWNLSFDWMRDEFIMAMRGAYPFVRDSSECIFGRQGQVYSQLDFSTVLNCERRPTLIDLPLEMTNNSDLGNLPFCCRNGTILPPTMDPSKSTSKFQMNVFKMPPDVNRSELTVPQNWKIEGRLNSDYTCGPPVRVSPSEFPGPFGLSTETTAVASWQVVCNITQAKNSNPRCCVSFSAYYNESIIPCPTCACGCPRSAGGKCSTTSPALFLPSQALLVPFENRTKLSTAWASLKHQPVPNPLPCGDNCGVSLNWHVLTNFKGGWSARLTLFNWEDSSFADWFVAVELDKAGVDFERVYSFNGSTIPNNGVNNTVFMQGLPGLNYLVGETDGVNPEKDPRVPGKQQSVLSFKKKNMPNIDIVGGLGFPSRVLFNGEECALPKIIPTNGGLRVSSGAISSAVLAVVVLVFMQQQLQPRMKD